MRSPDLNCPCAFCAQVHVLHWNPFAVSSALGLDQLYQRVRDPRVLPTIITLDEEPATFVVDCDVLHRFLREIQGCIQVCRQTHPPRRPVVVANPPCITRAETYF